MLGWEIFVKSRDQTIASWMMGSSGTSWLRELVKEGKATDVAINCGYPHVFSMKARDLIPILINGIPQSGGGLVIGENYVIDGNRIWDLNINAELLANCSPDDELVIDAWDQS